MAVKSVSKQNIDVTVMLNAHSEGLLMHPTLKSLARSIAHAQRKGLVVELLVILDRPDTATKNYIGTYLKKIVTGVSVVVKQVDFGDPGLARNYGIKHAQGVIIGNLDADDLFSENLITVCVEEVRKSKGTAIIHPEYILSFGMYNEIWRLRNSDTEDFDWAATVEYNFFSGPSFATAALRKEYPYREVDMRSGFGPEDWQWNMDTLGAGLSHLVAPQTCYFYRRKHANALSSLHSSHRLILGPTSLLGDKYLANKVAFDYIASDKNKVRPSASQKNVSPKTIAQRVSIIPRRALAFAGRQMKYVRKYRRLQAFEHYLRIAFSELLATSVSLADKVERVEVPDWLLQEWRFLHDLDHRVYPSEELLSSLQEYRPRATTYAKVYWDLLKRIYFESDYVFFVPTIGIGGADHVTLNYIRALLDINPAYKITVIASEPKNSTHAHLLPKQVRFIHLTGDYHSLTSHQRSQLIALLMVQARVKRIHTINSSLGYWLFLEYAPALSTYASLYMSIFGPDRLADSRRTHVLLDDVEFAQHITRIFTDNQNTADEFMEWCAYPADLFSVHYQPVKLSPAEGAIRHKADREKGTLDILKVLWAGRMDKEKHPDVLVAIATECQKRKLPVTFEAYGSPVLDDGKLLAALKECPAVTYKGKFEGGLGSLPLHKYDLFLMTSEWEGLPNALLEAAAGGVPILAPRVGGIPEFVKHGETGLLVEQYDDIAGYVKVLEDALIHPITLERYRNNAQKLVGKRHDWDNFKEELRAEQGYIG